MPSHLRPLGELEPVIRTLASLDVERSDYRYYPQALREAAVVDADDDTKQWLELALGLDYTARTLIQFALRSAAHHAASEAEPWVELARQAGADEGAEVLIINFAQERDEGGEVNEDEQIASLKEKLSRLESFASLAAIVITDIRGQLDFDDVEQN